MKFKRWMLLLIGLALLATMVGCGTAEEVSYEDDPEAMDQLTIYYHEDWWYMREYKLKRNIDMYNQRWGCQRSVKMVLFKDAQSMYDRLLDDLMIGEGPDIIYLDRKAHQYINIAKIAKQNVFADMDILAEQDDTFNLDDYNAMAMETGLVDGKRVMMPVSYRVLPMLAIKECFEGNGFSIPDRLTMDIYLDYMESFHQRHEEPALLGIDPVYLLSEYIVMGKTIEDEDRAELKRVLGIIQEEHQRGEIYPHYADKREWQKHYRSQYEDAMNRYVSTRVAYGELMLDKHLLFYDMYEEELNFFHGLYHNYNIFRQSGGELVLMQQPHRDDDIKAYTDDFLLINVNSKQKNKAFQFVEYMMSVNTSRDIVTHINLPISKEGYGCHKEALLEGYSKDFTSPKKNVVAMDEEVQLPQEIKDQTIAYVEGVDSCQFIGEFQYIYYNVINEHIQDYYNDHITCDELIDAINNKLGIYYSE